MAYYDPPSKKVGDTRPPCPPPNCAHAWRTTPVFTQHEQAVIEWAWRVISIVACYHNAKQWCTDMESLQSDWIRNFFLNSISNPYPKI